MKKKLDENQQLFFELISEGYGKRDFNYLLEFWEKIRKNLSKFYVNQKIFSLIKEIDKNVKNIEPKIELFKEDSLKIKVSKEENKIYHRVHINKINNNINKNFLRSSTKVDAPFNKKKISNNKIKVNNLENPIFQNSEEIINKNIFEKTKNNNKIISFIEIDLLLNRIAQMKIIYDDPIMETNLLSGFCLQHTAFMNTDILVCKIISCFNYFYTLYLNKDEEPKLNNQNIDTFVRLRYKYGNRPLNKKEESNKNILNRDSGRIPYNIINLLFLFVDLHDIYCNSTITHEIIKKIQNFYQSILGINQIKAKYENELFMSLDILKKNEKFYNIKKN